MPEGKSYLGKAYYFIGKGGRTDSRMGREESLTNSIDKYRVYCKAAGKQLVGKEIPYFYNTVFLFSVKTIIFDVGFI
jgi:hypothetical protein